VGLWYYQPLVIAMARGVDLPLLKGKSYMEQYKMQYAGGREQALAEQNRFFRSVYAWMGAGLAITALLSVLTVSSPVLTQMVFGNRFVFYGLVIGELGLVIALSAAINRLNAATAIFLFVAYSALNGVTLSVIFMAYTAESIASTFLVTAATFGAMSIYGAITRRDLTSWGSFLFMGLIGVVIASLVNLFLHSEMIYWISTYCGIIVFVGLTAYDAQKIKALGRQGYGGTKPAILGALSLYLDFINLFLLLLRVMGRRR
jgi:FtsH-binding integral membrane protein